MSQPLRFSAALALLVLGCNSAEDQADPDAASGSGMDGGDAMDAGDDDPPIDAGRDAGMPIEPGGSCRSDDDCADGQLFCVGPEENVCGIPPREECAFNADCSAFLDGRCQATADSCSPDGVGSLCQEGSCLPTSCGIGFICQNGGCVPLPCDEGFVCSPSEECDASSIDASGPAHALTHGCVPIACTDDEACPNDTVCVNGRCQTGLGTCSLPPP